MTVRVAIHQPNYLPWLGFFGKLLDADIFVLLDTVQFTKNGYQNRVRVKGPQGPLWLTQPVRLSGRFAQPTSEVEFADARWGSRHLKTLHSNYARAPFYADVVGSLEPVLTQVGERLADCNERLIVCAARVLGAGATIIRASSLLSEPLERTERLVRIVRAVEGDVYLAGTGGLEYQDAEVFARSGVRVEQARVSFPPYTQLWGDFVPGLSIVDLLMNCGPESAVAVLREGVVGVDEVPR